MSDIVCGVHAVRLALERGQVKRLLLDQRRKDRRLDELRGLAARNHVDVSEVPSAELEQLSAGVRHQGALAEIEGAAPLTENQLETWLAAANDPLVLVLDGVEDPRNFGACLRTADGAGVDAVVIPRRRAAGLTPAARKTAAGAAEALPIYTVTNLSRVLDTMGAFGLRRVGAVLTESASPPWQCTLSGPLALVLGAEGEGVRRLTREHLDETVFLPMHGVVESLNVAVACGVLLYEVCRQREV